MNTINQIISHLSLPIILLSVTACTVPSTSNIPIDTKQSEVLSQQALDKVKKGELQSALEDYNQAIEANPENSEAYNNRGNAYFFLNQPEEAIKNYNQAIKLNPELSRAYYNRGFAYQRQGKTELAVKDFNKTLSLNPDYLPAYLNRAVVRSILGDNQGAIEDYNEVIKKDPNLPQVYFNRAASYSELGDQEKAMKDLEKAGQLFAKQGNTEALKKTQEVLSQLK